LTPAQVRTLAFGEYTAMHDYLREWLEAQRDGG
jgi:hypothetical protein